ncbi:hypothetical protein B566_EDAN010967 [Ephemera danica]|nr:hypothetical protein B566_EDAN010967 [Ephemera danica]
MLTVLHMKRSATARAGGSTAGSRPSSELFCTSEEDEEDWETVIEVGADQDLCVFMRGLQSKKKSGVHLEYTVPVCAACWDAFPY